MATLSNYISLSTNIPNAMNAAANATTKAYQSMNTLHNKMNGVSSASETLKASMGGLMNSKVWQVDNYRATSSGLLLKTRL